MTRPVFKLDYHPLSEKSPALGQVAVIPWDTEIFGFPVGKYKLGDPHYLILNKKAFLDALTRWTRLNAVELISTSVPADDFPTLTLLRGLGFHYVDCSLQTTLRRIQSIDFPDTPSSIRRAQPEDQESLEHMAENIFNSGHYCADCRFPSILAHKRFRQWLRNAFLSDDPDTYIFVQGAPGKVKGFFHVEKKEDLADLRLAGVYTNSKAGIARSGFSLYRDTLRAVKNMGLRNARAIVYAANTSAVNIHSALGFRFSSPEAQLHWYAPNALHLLDFG